MQKVLSLTEGYQGLTPDVATQRWDEFTLVHEQYAHLEFASRRSGINNRTELSAAGRECLRAARDVREVLPQDRFLEHNQQKIDEYLEAFKVFEP
jgi:hypothetical protein